MSNKKENKPNFSDRVGSAIDGAISIISPERAYRRQAFRNARQIMGASFRGAERNKLLEDWFPQGFSADRDLLYEQSLLRERSRDLVRNDAHASGIVSTVTTNVIGSGIKPQSRIDKKALGITDDQVVEFQYAVEKIWNAWALTADAGERLDFYEIQELILRQILENGEVVLLPLMPSDRKPFSLCFETVEADRLLTPFDKVNDKSVRYGIRLGDKGEPVEYYIRKYHPGDFGLRKAADTYEYATYAAKNKFGRKNVFHLYDVKRPGQTRGIPYFAPVLAYFKHKADYMEAELVAARLAACFALLITSPAAYNAALANTEDNGDAKRMQSFFPGMVKYLNPGEQVTAFNPNRPNTQFDSFINSLLRSICSALNLSYEIVAKDFSQTNYSSARASLLQAYKFFMIRQDWMAKKICQPAWEYLLEEAFLRDQLPAWVDFGKNPKEWCRARWVAPGWQWVDPVAEAESSQLSMDMGISTLADESAAQGKDWEEVLGQKVRELVKIKKLEEENGIVIIKDKSSQPSKALKNNAKNQEEVIP